MIPDARATLVPPPTVSIKKSIEPTGYSIIDSPVVIGNWN